MTALPNPVPNQIPRRTPSHDDPPTNHDDAVLIGGDVPIAVWRLDDRDDDGLVTDPADRLAARLAQRLLLVYTQRGDAVVDLDNSPQLHAISTHLTRSYLSITDPDEIADLDTLAEPVSLVVLRWPPRHTTRTPATIADLFTACRLIMTADTCTVVAVTPAEPGRPGTRYAEHLRDLQAAARAAGLTNVLQIVAVTNPGDGDQFLYYATPAEAAAARRDQADGDGRPGFHIDLLIFTSEARRHERA